MNDENLSPEPGTPSSNQRKARYLGVAGFVCFLVLLTQLWIPQWFPKNSELDMKSAVELKHYPVDALDGVVDATGLTLDKAISSDGNGAFRITSSGATTIRLYETGDLDIENTMLVYQAKMRTENFEGQAYLEMWCQFSKGEYFSKGLNAPLSGTTEWQTEATPFFLKEGENPTNVKLSVTLNGKGTVWIDDIRVFRKP